MPAGCPACDYANPPGFKFCGECGRALSEGERPAPEPRSYTPKHLADKILTSRSAIEGERKRVTVLFADVQGSMDLSEQLDPEDWHGVLDRFFAILTEGIHRFEGNVNQYTGDGIMALFGAPISHEDHAQRACYAALHLQEQLANYSTEVKRTHGIGFSVRMGIHSGEVVVGRIGDDLRMDYTAQGHTVGLAARMQTLASPDTCYLTNATEAIVSAYFDLENLGEFDIKGARERVGVFRLRGIGSARTRFDVSRSRGLSRFVGRGNDMQTLEDALAQARMGNGQVVGVVAYAGTGKSRLCFEFAEQCRANGLQVLEGSAVAHGKNIPFLPMLQVFRSYYGISESDSDRAAREKIAGRVLLIDESFRRLLPLMFDFFGVPDPGQPSPPMDPDTRRRQVIATMRRLLQAEDARDPLFTLIEDLHWIDSGSEGLLEEMVNAVAGTRHLILVNFRPEYHADWMQKSWYRQLPLAPLGPDAIRELLQDLLGDDPSTDGLAETIHNRTQGNPFFTEEVIQSLIESGNLEGTRGAYRLVAPIESLDVPVTVQAVLAARIDKLGDREKQILQTAAVIGKEFPSQILEDIADLPEEELAAGLAALRSHEFIYEQSLYPSVVYAFKHPLTQEVALASQLNERRRAVHGAVAEAIEKHYLDELDERAALLAHHHEHAGNTLPAARWHSRAGDWARFTDRDAAGFHFERIRALVATLDAGRETDELALTACTRILDQRWRVGIELEQARALFDEGEQLAVRLDDTASRCRLRSTYGRAALSAGDIDERMRAAREAFALAEEADDPDAQADALVCMADACQFWGKLTELSTYLDQFESLDSDIELGIETYGVSLVGVLHTFRSLVLGFTGDFAGAYQATDRGHAIARDLNMPELDCWVYGYAAVNARLAGEPERGMELARRTGEAARAAGSPAHLEAQEQRALYNAHSAAGDGPAAREAAESYLRILVEAGTERIMQAEAPAMIAAATLLSGDAEDAVAAARHGVSVAKQMGRLDAEIVAQLALAGALAARSETAQDPAIETAIARSEWLIEESGAHFCRAELCELRSRVAAARGDSGAAADLREQARGLYIEMNAPRRAARIA